MIRKNSFWKFKLVVRVRRRILEFFLRTIFPIGVAFLISLIYIFIFIACRIKIRDRLVQDYPAPPTAPPPPPLPPTPLHHEFPVAKTPPMPWTSEVPYAPYAPY
jgi:hypothetical protein